MDFWIRYFHLIQNVCHFSVGNHFFQTLAKMASGLKLILAKMTFFLNLPTNIKGGGGGGGGGGFADFDKSLTWSRRINTLLRAASISSSSISLSSSFKF